jgi:EAL domain-containing protein (putative c-di-GMP-specific phosphodiesterase class I)
MPTTQPQNELVIDPPHVEAVGRFSHPALDGFPITTLANGRVVGEFYSAKLASVFQPIVAADGKTFGHHGYLRVASASGESLTPYAVFARAVDDLALVKLDRLTRSLHALNYFHRAPEHAKLVVHVEQRLLGAIANEHGAVFESILAALSIKPDRVVISLPHTALSNPGTLVRSILSYRNRGYGVVVQVNGLSDPGLGRLFLAEPQFVQFDLPKAEDYEATKQFVRALHRNGYQAIARKIETAEQATAAREIGFDLLHGYHIGSHSVNPWS